MGAVAAAAILHKEKEIVARFRDAGATVPERAITAAALGVHEGVAFRKLRRREVLREVAAGRLYLDEPRWAALGVLRRRIAFTMLVVVIVFGVVAFAVASRR